MTKLQIQVADVQDLAKGLTENQGNDFAWYVTALAFIGLMAFAVWTTITGRKEAKVREDATELRHNKVLESHEKALAAQAKVFEEQGETYRGIIDQTTKALDANTNAMAALRTELHNVTNLLSQIIISGGLTTLNIQQFRKQHDNQS